MVVTVIVFEAGVLVAAGVLFVLAGGCLGVGEWIIALKVTSLGATVVGCCWTGVVVELVDVLVGADVGVV